MSVSESLSQRKSSAKWRMPSDNALLAAVAIAFLVLHILAGVILLRAGADEAVSLQQTAAATLYD